MRMTVTIDDELIDRAKDITGLDADNDVIQEALRRMIRREAALQLIAAGGTMPDLEYTPQRRLDRE